MKVVVDTNVIISSALTPAGNSANVINLIADSEEFQLFYSAEMLIEYEEVLSRKHLRIDSKKQKYYIKAIKNIGIKFEPTTSGIPLPDESDRIFYDTARDAGAILITGNKKHYPKESFIMTPAEFLTMLDNIG